MSLFVGGLAFDGGGMLESAKLGILAASVISAILGLVVLSRRPPEGRGSRR
jgi:NhaA family Na+:H+ antiporter